MDNAVALVQAYLRVKSYFTVAEFSVLEAIRHGGYREVTDIDFLAFFCFPAARRAIGRSERTGIPTSDDDNVRGANVQGSRAPSSLSRCR